MAFFQKRLFEPPRLSFQLGRQMRMFRITRLWQHYSTYPHYDPYLYLCMVDMTGVLAKQVIVAIMPYFAIEELVVTQLGLKASIVNGYFTLATPGLRSSSNYTLKAIEISTPSRKAYSALRRSKKNSFVAHHTSRPESEAEHHVDLLAETFESCYCSHAPAPLGRGIEVYPTTVPTEATRILG